MKLTRIVLLVLVAVNFSLNAFAASWESLNAQVTELYQKGEYSKAVPIAQQALDEAEASYGANSSQTALAVNNLALLYKKTNKMKAAETNYLRALNIFEKIAGADHPDVAVPLNNLALFYESQGNTAKAEEYSKRAVALLEKAYGPNHPNTLEAKNRYKKLMAN